jgi:hypothetical protein
MSVRDGVTVGVREGVLVEVKVLVKVGVIEGVDVCEAVAVGEKVAVDVNVNVAVAVGSRLAVAVPSPPVFGTTKPRSEISGCDELHRRFGKLKPHMAITISVAQIK